MTGIPIVSKNLVREIEWQGDSLYYDYQLSKLGNGADNFIVPNTNVTVDLDRILTHVPRTVRCIVWKCKGEWIAKKFHKNWTPNHGYLDIEVPEHILDIDIKWEKNPDIDPSMVFEDDPYESYAPTLIDCFYELVWYIDPRFNPTTERVWARKCYPADGKSLGVKYMGYLTPQIKIEFNSELPDMNLDLDSLCPPYDNMSHERAYMLDKKHAPFEDIWVVKISPAYKTPEPLIWVGVITPEFTVVYNESLPKMDYEIDYNIPWRDFKYEHMWMLDKKHTENLTEEIWAVKILTTNKPKGTKVMGYVSPKITTLVNPDLPKMKIDVDYDIQYHDFEYEHVWYVDKTVDKIWAFKIKAVDNPIGEKDMGTILSSITDRLDVIFISYNEPNADDNWKKVLARAHWAQRIHGVNGIFNAHKAAAKLAKTDMFFVVDGDADLADDWNFDFQPSIFNRDCAYVWSSRNPVNDLIYQNGGVKLFPKRSLMKKRKWNTLDMFTGLMKEIKVNDVISCTTNFNTDEFSTWRSAFRECVKLYTTTQITKLTAWLESDVTKPFGKYAVDGAHAGYEYARKNKDNQKKLLKINDYKWLEQQFKKHCSGVKHV